MKEIIKPGKYSSAIFAITCNNCDCIFKYNKAEITTETKANIELSTVTCPECGEVINHSIKINEPQPLNFEAFRTIKEN